MKVLILIFGVICGSTAGAFIRLASAPSPVLVVYRMFFSLVLLAPMVWLHRKEFSAMARKTLLLCICSGMSLGLHFVTYFESVKNTSLAASSVLVNMEVLFVALATVLIFHRKLSGKAWLAVLLAFGTPEVQTSGNQHGSISVCVVLENGVYANSAAGIVAAVMEEYYK